MPDSIGGFRNEKTFTRGTSMKGLRNRLREILSLDFERKGGFKRSRGLHSWPAGIAGLQSALIIYFAGILEWQTLGFEGEKIPSLAKISRVDGKDGMKSISGCCHILLFYGLGGTDLPHFSSGNDALRALTDDERAISIFGKSPFVVTRNGLRYFLSEDPIFHSDVGESHQDRK